MIQPHLLMGHSTCRLPALHILIAMHTSMLFSGQEIRDTERRSATIADARADSFAGDVERAIG